MAKKCSESDCERDAQVKGLCSLHYQRIRRQEKDGQGKVGRPREYTEDTADPGGGAPRITVRLEPDLLEWVRQQGGGGWLRHVSRELRDLSQHPEFLAWWDLLMLPVESES